MSYWYLVCQAAFIFVVCFNSFFSTLNSAEDEPWKYQNKRLFTNDYRLAKIFCVAKFHILFLINRISIGYYHYWLKTRLMALTQVFILLTCTWKAWNGWDGWPEAVPASGSWFGLLFVQKPCERAFNGYQFTRLDITICHAKPSSPWRWMKIRLGAKNTLLCVHW